MVSLPLPPESLFLYLLFLTILILYDKKFSSQEALIEYIKEETVKLYLHVRQNDLFVFKHKSQLLSLQLLLH